MMLNRCVSFQIRQFSFRLLHQTMKMNAFEFFDVDYTLIFKVNFKFNVIKNLGSEFYKYFQILGTTTCYLIILIQFTESA